MQAVCLNLLSYFSEDKLKWRNVTLADKKTRMELSFISIVMVLFASQRSEVEVVLTKLISRDSQIDPKNEQKLKEKAKLQFDFSK